MTTVIYEILNFKDLPENGIEAYVRKRRIMKRCDACSEYIFPEETYYDVFDADVGMRVETIGGRKVVIVTGHDISALKSAEKALLEREREFRMLADTLPVAIYLSSGVEQACEYLNPTFTKLFGYRIEEVPSVAEWWPKAYPDKAYRDVVSTEWNKWVARSRKAGDSIEPVETRVTCKDGSEKTILWSYQVIGDKGYACGLDLTERKKAAESLKQQNKELQRFNKTATGRELRMVELKREINSLCVGLGREEPYPLFSSGHLGDAIDEAK